MSLRLSRPDRVRGGVRLTEGRDGLVEEVERLQSELAAGVQWENGTLSRFLEAFSASLGSIENDYLNTGRPVPEDPWVLVAAALASARYYE